MARCENISSRNKVYESRARNVADARGCEVKVEGSGETAKWIRKAGNEYRPRGREDAGDVSAVVLSFLNWTRGSGHLSARPFTLFPSRNQPSSLAASLFPVVLPRNVGAFFIGANLSCLEPSGYLFNIVTSHSGASASRTFTDRAKFPIARKIDDARASLPTHRGMGRSLGQPR